MSLNQNLCVMTGRLVADPELRTTTSGISVCSFCIAINRPVTERGKDPETDFINCVAWRSTADFVSKYFSKGMSISTIGRLQSRKYDDKQGNKRVAFEVICDKVDFVESKKSQNEYASAPQESFASAQRAQPGRPAQSFEEIDDDDLPF